MNNMDKNNRKTLFRTTAIAASIFALSACGGGGGSSSSSDDGGTSTAPTSNVADQIKPGVFETFNVSEEMLGFSLLSPTGEIRVPLERGIEATLSTGDQVIISSQEDIIIGDLQFRTDASFSGGGNRIFFDGAWDKFGVAVNGNVQGESMSVTAKAPDSNFDRTRVLRRDGKGDVNEISEAIIEGYYVFRAFTGGTASYFQVGPGNNIEGFGGSSNCTFNRGEFNIPDPKVNVFEVSFTAEGCDSADDNGPYTGLAGYEEVDGVGRLTLIADNGLVNAWFLGVDEQ